MTEAPTAAASTGAPLLPTAPEPPELLPPPEHDAGDGNRGSPPKDRSHKLRIVALAMVGIVVLLLIGWFFHHRRASEAEDANRDAREHLPTVSVIEAKASPSTSDLRLPGSISPLTEAAIFARASGYLATRYVDIGDTVRRGQVLAEIDSPDFDQQVAMARQQLDQSRPAVDDAKARVAAVAGDLRPAAATDWRRGRVAAAGRPGTAGPGHRQGGRRVERRQRRCRPGGPTAARRAAGLRRRYARRSTAS